MNKINKLRLAFIITISSIIILSFIIGIIGLSIALKRSAIENDPTLQGMYPSIGLGKTFSINRLDYLIDAYIIEIHDRFGVPLFYDRVKEMIDENYILVGETYYYRDYLASNPYLYNEFIFIIIFISLYIFAIIFIISMFFFISYLNDDKTDLILNKKRKIILTILCYLSLNIYSALIISRWECKK